jgi:hypothetical protein
METEKKFDSKEENTIPDGASLLANQSQTAAQKRQKKMNSFDKPKKVLQRLRPISKRKVFLFYYLYIFCLLMTYDL